MKARSTESGQAAVEAALTLPLTLFLFLMVLQLFLMAHGRIAAQLAAYGATRVGSTNHGHCGRMTHAALLSVLPAVQAFMSPGLGGTAGDKVASLFSRVRDNRYDQTFSDGGSSTRYAGSIVWLIREQPLAGSVRALGAQDLEFDDDRAPMRLETRLVFWYPLKVPFANWVMSRMWHAQHGLQAFDAQNPLLPVGAARWSERSTYALQAAVASETLARALRGELVFPIETSWTMRMMTPAKAANFQRQNCSPAPENL
ncbi:MAG: pilus assembly protein [Myxococcaceae bacterium]|nr:pilus assembly protein [Myxococcaceae bacterium]